MSVVQLQLRSKTRYDNGASCRVRLEYLENRTKQHAGVYLSGVRAGFFYKINARNDRSYAKLNTVYLNELCILINMFIRLAFRPSTGILLTTDHLSRNNDRELDISNSGLTHSDP